MSSQNFTFLGDVRADQIINGNHNTISGDRRSSAPEPEWDGPEVAPPPVFGIVTALPEEFAAVRALLDDPRGPHTVASDRALYVRGRMPSREATSPHEVVLTLLGDTGNTAAAEACANLIRSFPSVDTVLMCGIACGVPDPDHPERHVRLGDIVAATWGIADYDHVVETDGGWHPRQPFPLPSPLLVRLAQFLAAVEIGGERPWDKWITVALDALPAYARPSDTTDLLSDPDDPGRTTAHPPTEASGHPHQLPKVHRGLIGSADRSLRSAKARDALTSSHRMIAFEMEGKGIGGAGFAGGLEWFVVRGISDYGDVRTSLQWRGYAAIVAAAYVRALLAECPPLTARGGHTQATGEGQRSRRR
jgi:nucleoside phosphorylase